MPYPPYVSRQISYRQNESAGNEIPTAMLDSEFNDVEEVMNQINRRVRSITNVAGQLINVSAQIAQALVGTQRFAPVGATTVFLTTITWDSSFSNGNVLVNANGLMVDPNTVSVADNGGFLEVTLGTAVSSGWVDVAAFSQGAGISTQLASTANAEGASLIGIEDVGGYYTAVEVEGALQEVAADLAALISTLGTLSKIWTSDGVTVAGGAATADFDLGGFKITNMADAVANTDAVTLQQLLAVTQNLDTLLALFIRADGTVPFTGNQSMGGHRLTDLGTAIANGDAVTFLQYNNIDGSQITTGTIAGIRLGVFGGATALADGTVGAVPAPLMADFTSDHFLSADGSWKAVPSNLGGYILLEHQAASGTDGGAIAGAASWETHPLTTEVVDTGGDCTLAANQFTLTDGTYRLDAKAIFYRVTTFRLRLYNVTDAVMVDIGLTNYGDDTDGDGATATLTSRFDVTGGPKIYELQYWAGNGAGTQALGRASSTGSIEKYASVNLIKED